MTDSRKFDIVVFGASGYTGCYVIQELGKSDLGDLKWCAAGRNKEKIRSALTKMGTLDGKNFDSIEIIETDVNNEESLIDMCKQTKLVINCVGPYRFFGEQVVKACVKSSTHHIDVSGEPQFLEKMQMKYFDEAREKNIYIVGACGFDSIPCDLGVEVFKDKFDGDVNFVESYLKFKNSVGTAANYGTWQSAVHGLAHAAELKPLRRDLKRKVFPKDMPKSRFPIKKRPLLFKSKVTNKWCIPFIGSDRSIVLRTQMYNYNYKDQRPVQMQAYMCMPSLAYALGTLFLGLVFMILAKFHFGRRLLEEYPEFFSCGAFSKKEPPIKKSSDGLFSMTLRGQGWSEKLASPNDQHVDKPDKDFCLVVEGPEAYVSTAICVVQSALTLLMETDKLPGNGGVLTPGAAFLNTRLSEKLASRGLTFEVKH